MQRLNLSSTSCALAAIAVLTLGACTKHEEPAAVAALPPPPPPPAPVPPPPSADDQLNGRLAELGATPSDAGWRVTLSSAKFRDGKVSFAADDEATVTKVITLLQRDSHLRVQIENYTDKRGPKARVRELSQMHANAVVRDLTSKGGDEARIQAEGRVESPGKPRVEFIFSNAEGEFPPPPVEHS